MTSIQVYPNSAAQTRAAVDLFVSLAGEAVKASGSFSVALSGGSTPRMLYAGLAAPERQEFLSWADMHLFFGDERLVPPDHPDSNFRMVEEALLSKVPIPGENIHRVKAELDPRLAAFNYEEALRGFFDDPWPRFDLVLLGMGADGHTASLFPKTAALNEEQRWFVANFVADQKAWRLTLTKRAINAARKVMVLVSGRSKANMLAEVLTGAYDPTHKPIQLISPVDGEMMWLIDQDAASQLPDTFIS